MNLGARMLAMYFTTSCPPAAVPPSAPSAPARINFTEGVDSEWRTDETEDKLMKAERAQRGERERDMCDNRRSKEEGRPRREFGSDIN